MPADHVWLVSDVYPPRCGGSGWSAHALARMLAERNHRVEVIVVDPAGTGLTQRVYEEIPILEVGVRGSRRNPLRRLGARDYSHAALARYLDRQLRQDPSVGVVHAQHLHSGPPALAAARRNGRAGLLTLRDYWPSCLHGTSWWGGAECEGCTTTNLVGCMREYWRWPAPAARLMVPWARRRLAARRSGIVAADRVIAVSEWVRQRVQRDAAEATFAVLPNIVDERLAAAAADAGDDLASALPAPFVMTAGKLLPTKGFDEMLSALHRVGCRWPVVIAGSGPERQRLESRVAELGLDVVFLGWVEHSSLLRLMRSAHAFLLPAAWNEPLSRLLLEAVAVGTPVVAWKSGGNHEHLTDGVDAWVVANDDDLARALGGLADDSTRARVGEAGRALARERFSPDALYPRLMDLYAAATDAARRRALIGVTGGSGGGQP